MTSSSDAPHRQPRERPVSLLLEIVSAHQLMGELLNRELEREGATSDGLAVLSYVGAGGPITPGELSNALGLPPTTITATIRRLVDRGHVERVANPDDGRSYHVRLTPAGEDAFHRAGPAIRRTHERIAEHLALPVEDVRGALRELDAAIRAALAGTSALT